MKRRSNNVRSQAVDLEFAKLWGDYPLPDIGTYPLSHRIHAGHAMDFVRYAATVQETRKRQFGLRGKWLIGLATMQIRSGADRKGFLRPG